MTPEVQGMAGKRSCAIGDEASWSGSKKERTETLQSESEIEIVGDEYEAEEEEEVRVFTAEEMAQYYESMKIFWELNNKTSRYQEAYNECLKRTQGFDLPSDIEESLSEGERPMNQITKCGKSAFGPDRDVGQAAIWALREQNKLMNSNLELVEVVKANAKLVSGIIYYITLVAQDNATSERNTYQAKVYEPFHGDSKLRLFRLVDAQDMAPSGVGGS